MRGLIPTLRRFLHGDSQETPRPPDHDDFWYGPAAPRGSSAGQLVTPDTALQVAQVYRAVSIIADAVAVLPMPVYRRGAAAREKERVDDHEVARLLRRPNPWQTDFEFRRQMQAMVLLRGNAYARIFTDPRSGALAGLVLLHPERMHVEMVDGFRRRYQYTWSDGRRETLLQDEVLHLMALSTDGITGLSPITLARTTIGTAKAMAAYSARQFTDQPKLAGVLTTDAELGDEAARRVEQSMRRNWAGEGNWFGVPVFEQGLKFQSVGMSNEDAQFLDSRRFGVTEIATWFGVPAHMLGDSSRATWGNVESFGVEFLTFTLLPWLRNIESRFGLQFLDEEHFVEHITDALLRGDGASRADRQVKYLQNGVLSPNEIRALENMNPRDGGDDYWESVNAARPSPKG